MKEHPIIMSTPMVRAILEGRKNQTRRVISAANSTVLGYPVSRKSALWTGLIWDARVFKDCGPHVRCKYEPGDRLWVKETHTWVTLAEKDPWKDRAIADGSFRRTDKGEPVMMCYKADGYEIPASWRPSIFTPRWASRLTLEITNVRVEKLNCITESDAHAEGMTGKLYQEATGRLLTCARDVFQWYWDSLNGKRGYGWTTNPWVWVLTFKKVDLGEG